MNTKKFIIPLLIVLSASVYYMSKIQSKQVSLQTTEDQVIAEAFANWTLKHKRLYSTSDHHNLRFNIFKENYKFIQEKNSQGLSYTLGLNETADLTHEEFSAKYGLTKPEIPLNGEFVESESEKLSPEEQEELFNVNLQKFYKTYGHNLTQTPDKKIEVDWQALKKSNKARNIGSCHGVGSLMGVISTFESAIACKYNTDAIMLSPQYALDCGDDSNGCIGQATSAYVSWVKSKGVVLESQYAYNAQKNTCPTISGSKYYIKDYRTYTSNLDQDITNLVLQQPIITWISVDSEVRFYSGGLYVPTSCSSQNNGIYVNIDGLSMDSVTKKGHYLVKFPWGEVWGDDGNMKFYKDPDNNYTTKNICGFYIQQYLITPN